MLNVGCGGAAYKNMPMGTCNIPSIPICGQGPIICDNHYTDVPSGLDGCLVNYLENYSACNGCSLTGGLASDGAYLFASASGLNFNANTLAVRANMVDNYTTNLLTALGDGIISNFFCDIEYLSGNLALFGNILCSLSPILNNLGLGANLLGNDINIIDNTANNFLLRELMQYCDISLSYQMKNLANNIEQLGGILDGTGISLAVAGDTLINFGSDLIGVACIVNDLAITNIGSCYGGESICPVSFGCC